MHDFMMLQYNNSKTFDFLTINLDHFHAKMIIENAHHISSCLCFDFYATCYAYTSTGPSNELKLFRFSSNKKLYLIDKGNFCNQEYFFERLIIIK